MGLDYKNLAEKLHSENGTIYFCIANSTAKVFPRIAAKPPSMQRLHMCRFFSTSREVGVACATRYGSNGVDS